MLEKNAKIFVAGHRGLVALPFGTTCNKEVIQT